jgi:hypothetical protein
LKHILMRSVHRFDNSGHKVGFPGWHSNSTNVARTNAIIKRLASMFAGNTNVVPVIAPLNEYVDTTVCIADFGRSEIAPPTDLPGSMAKKSSTSRANIGSTPMAIFASPSAPHNNPTRSSSSMMPSNHSPSGTAYSRRRRTKESRWTPINTRSSQTSKLR